MPAKLISLPPMDSSKASMRGGLCQERMDVRPPTHGEQVAVRLATSYFFGHFAGAMHGTWDAGNFRIRACVSQVIDLQRLRRFNLESPACGEMRPIVQPDTFVVDWIRMARAASE